ncbi:MAG TPA: hypothetical protein VFM38_01415, partial [Candidatus Limnocylindrales bacterium]|nr:hypothetical protein [Candidatus Limnocylindrales bacterium]
GSVALAFVGTIFASTFQEDLIPQLTAAGVPPQILATFAQGAAGGALDTNQLTGVGDIGAAILASVPPQYQDVVRPAIPAIVEGIHGAFSLAVGATFWLGVAGSIIAALAAVAIDELPLRSSNAAPAARQQAQGSAPAKRAPATE